MNDVFVLDEEFNFSDKIHEITSIAIEHKYDINGSKCEGEFIISGDYRLHEITVNKEEFSFHLPFNNEVRSNVNLDSVEIEITDFNYELEDDTLKVHIEYTVNGEQALIEFAEEADFDEFLKHNEAELVNLSNEERTQEESEVITEKQEEVIEEETINEIEEPKEEPTEEIREEESEEIVEEPRVEINETDMISNINSEESFITYHVHTVTTADSFESISNQYNININDLKMINNIEELILGMKLIIPDETN